MYIDEIFKVMDYLHNQISEIGKYPEKSLFFQDPRISEAWLHLVRQIEEVEDYSSLQHRNSTETNVLYILNLRMVKNRYRELYEEYYYQLKELLDGYGGWLTGECISKDGLEMLKSDRFTKYMGEVGEAETYLAMLNSKAPEVRSAVFKVLSDILNVMLAVIKRGQQLISERFPTLDDFVKALDDDLRAYTKDNKEAMLREMGEDLNRHYKARRTDPNLPEHWGEMLNEDEDALKLAKKQKLSNCETARQEHWGEAGKKEMDENGELMGRIYEMCYTDKLIDLKNPDNVQGILPLLNYENIEMFYKKIIRRNLIQCEMFPQLKAQYDEWLNFVDEDLNHEETLKPNAFREEINYYAPQKNLQEMLRQEWFKEVRRDSKYDNNWTDVFIEDLMKSEFGITIAVAWSLKGGRNKRNQIKGHVFGVLKDAGVMKGGYDTIAAKVVGKDEARTFGKYMGDGKNQPYAEWVKEYVAGEKD